MKTAILVRHRIPLCEGHVDGLRKTCFTKHIGRPSIRTSALTDANASKYASMDKLSIISNVYDRDAFDEDHCLATLLGQSIRSEVIDLSDRVIDTATPETFFLIRNIWGRPRQEMANLYHRLNKANSAGYLNAFVGRCDQQGKHYLLELYEQGYSVIPTFKTIRQAQTSGADVYLCKPIYGSSGKGIMIQSAGDLHEPQNGEFIVQPYIDAVFESSFFFIDNRFSYALKTRTSRWDLELYQPPSHELLLAHSFLAFNPMKGIQRFDFLHTTGGKQLLLEIEDWCPYLSLFDVPGAPRQEVVQQLLKSIGIVPTEAKSVAIS